MRREPRMYNGRLAHSASAEGQLAMGENCGEGLGAHDHRRRAAIGYGLTIVVHEARRAAKPLPMM